MPDEFANEAVDISTGYLGLNFPVKAVEFLGKLHRDAHALSELHNPA